MWWIVAIIIVIIIINSISSRNKRNKFEEKRNYYNNQYNNNNNTTPTSKVPKNPLYSMNLSDLFDEYKKDTDTPPLDSLVRRAYEKWEITSGRNNFESLSEADQKIILRIAINIWNKRKKDKTTTYKYSRKGNIDY